MAAFQLAPCTNLFLLAVEKVVTFDRITDTDFHGTLTTEILYNNFDAQTFCCKATSLSAINPLYNAPTQFSPCIP
jgi:hypothetical protein